MNVQEALEYSTTQLVKQGKQSLDVLGTGVYLNKEGCKCAIGWLANEGHENFLLENDSSLNYVLKRVDVLPDYIAENYSLFDWFQRFHDTTIRDKREMIYTVLKRDYSVKPHAVFEQWIELGVPIDGFEPYLF